MRLLFITFLSILTHISFAQKAYWQQHVAYTINASLNDTDKEINAAESFIYTNNSPDTLTFIWIHIWPNAYANDSTTFSDHYLENGSTDFYFSPKKDRGLMGNLSFTSNNLSLTTNKHPLYNDAVQVMLPQPLLPNNSITIATSFTVKLPNIFSRSGYVGDYFQVTQWYPKPAVYDANGWNIMPYTDQGEFYSEWGSFLVNIQLPNNYLVAATGNLISPDKKEELIRIGKQPLALQANNLVFEATYKKKLAANKSIAPETLSPKSSATTTTWTFSIDKAHDFAWFASKQFLVQYDTTIINNHVVNLWAFFHPRQKKLWANTINFSKRALHFYSNALTPYPYENATVVAGAKQSDAAGMEYPTITVINEENDIKELDVLIAHELGHNWFYGLLATNERQSPWMDEGMNTYYEKKYTQQYYPSTNKKFALPIENLLLTAVQAVKKDQPINTPALEFTYLNYGLIAYEKSAQFINYLETVLGKEAMATAMKNYAANWQYKHPTSNDFKRSIATNSGRNIDTIFNKLSTTNALQMVSTHKPIKLAYMADTRNATNTNYFNIVPIVAANYYDKFSAGVAFHNYQVSMPKLQFLIAPVYAFGSKQLNGAARISYNVYTRKYWLETSLSGISYSADNFQDASTGNTLYQRMSRFVPSVKYTHYHKDARNKQKWYAQIRRFFLQEQALNFNTPEVSKQSFNTYIHQARLGIVHEKALYPYEANLVIDQGKNFIRFGLTGKYYFNYASNKGGIQTRFFAGKFLYLTQKTFITQFETDRYHLNMTGPRGNEDYTYSGYFLGRNEFEGFRSQQMIERDGFFKVGTELFGQKVGKSDDWLAAINASADIPNNINPLTVLPIKIPLKLFADIGTNAAAWKDNPATGKFLFDAGLQVSFAKGLVNVYLPIMYSRVYRDYYKSVFGDKRFWRTVSFNIDLNRFSLHKISKDIPL